MDAERLPAGAYVASALMAAHITCDSGEDVDRFLNQLEARGYAVVPLHVALDAERKADASCPACGGDAGHDWWSVGDDSYACAAPAVTETADLRAALPELTGPVLARAWLLSGRSAPLLEPDEWDGFALTVRAIIETDRAALADSTDTEEGS